MLRSEAVPPAPAWRRLIRDPLLWLTAALFGLYLGVAAWRPAGVFWSLDEGGKFLYLQSVQASGDPRTPLPYPGRALDPDLEAVPLFYWIREGADIYSWWPVGFPLLSLPLYQMFGWLGLYVLPAAAGAAGAGLAGVLTRQAAPQAPGWVGLAAAGLTGLTTPLLIYSTLFWEHTLCVALFLGALWSILRAWSSGRPGWLVLAGGLAAGAVYLRFDMALFVAGAGLALTRWRWRWGLGLGAAFGLACLPWLALNWYWVGAFISRQAPAVGGGRLFYGLNDAGVWFIPYSLLNAPRVLALGLSPAALVAGTLLIILALGAPFLTRWRGLAGLAALGLAGLGAQALAADYGYRSVHGLVLIAPQIVWAAWLYVRPRAGLLALFAAMAAGAAGVYGLGYLAVGWVAAGGLQWGPRYMLTLYPLGLIAGLVGLWLNWPDLGRVTRAGLAAAFVVCAGVGAGFEARGVAAVGWTVNAYARAGQAIRALPSDLVVTPCTWLTMVVPDLYWSGRIFAPNDLEAWLQHAPAGQAPAIDLVAMNACENVALDEVARLNQQAPDGIVVTPLRAPATP